MTDAARETVRQKVLERHEADRARPVEPPTFDGGTEADRRRVLELHHAFLAANDALDSAALRKIWSSDPTCLFFNSNGHTYYGIDDWGRIWDHYRTRIRALRPYWPGKVQIVIRGDMALIVGDPIARYFEWISTTEPVPPLFWWPYVRHTQVCVRENGEWKIIHAHFSMVGEGARPDRAAEPDPRG